MSKKTRDYIFWVFVVIFVGATIIVSLYASGYKFNLSWPPKLNRLLIKTGMLIVKTQPDGATIYLNDRAQTNPAIFSWQKNNLITPAKIKNVLPGKYNLKLLCDGYLPWQKEITIYSGQTTFLENINLFRSNLPALISSVKEGELSLSPNRKYIYAGGAAEIIDLKTEQGWSLPLKTAGQWLKNSNKLSADGKLFDPNNKNIADYQKLVGVDTTNWYNDETTNRLYYQNKNSLGYLDINSKTIIPLLSGENYLAYEPQGDELFVVVMSGGQTKLEDYSLKDRQIKQEINLPTVGHYRFTPDNRPFLTLYDDQNNTLYLIGPDDFASNARTVKNIISWEWVDDNTLLYNNSWEIYLFDLKQNSSSLLTRVSEELKKIIWNKEKNYLIFSTEKSLAVFDLTNGLTTTIFKTEKISTPVLDDKSNILYFWAKIGQQEGVYEFVLQ